MDLFAQELVCAHLRRKGQLVSRQLAYDGVKFGTRQIRMANEHRDEWDAACTVGRRSSRSYRSRRARKQQRKVQTPDQLAPSTGVHISDSSERFSVGAKTDETVRLAKECVQRGQSVSHGLWSTNEARIKETLKSGGGWQGGREVCFRLLRASICIGFENLRETIVSYALGEHPLTPLTSWY